MAALPLVRAACALLKARWARLAEDGQPDVVVGPEAEGGGRAHLTFASGPTTFGRPAPQVLSSNLAELLAYSFTHFVFVAAISRQTLLATHPKTATVTIAIVLT